MNYTQRQTELTAQFRLNHNLTSENQHASILHFEFKSKYITDPRTASIHWLQDGKITENNSFVYPVFIPYRIKKANKFILLMHGLNERNWNKYLSWAEYLCISTGKPVVLFPIAFHMNRSPAEWSNPRQLQSKLNLRKLQNGDDRSLSFANIALSERISEHPARFYNSGRQTLEDLTQLLLEINEGKHPLFSKNSQIDIFSYSIGAFLSEIALMANPLGLFSDSRLFLFCGGGIFSSMYGESRSIMDKFAFQRLNQYYLEEFESGLGQNKAHDKAFTSFNIMISAERSRHTRETFFRNEMHRIKGIALAKDTVMPYSGMIEALGAECATSNLSLLDFPFLHTHENPFPTSGKADPVDINKSFETVFSAACQFLS